MRMPRRPSSQTLAVLDALLERSRSWLHGYDISKLTGLKSGTLYPILIRLSDEGLLETEWRDSDLPGRPQRHVYRLTRSGGQYARHHTEASRAPRIGMRPAKATS